MASAVGATVPVGDGRASTAAVGLLETVAGACVAEEVLVGEGAGKACTVVVTDGVAVLCRGEHAASVRHAMQKMIFRTAWFGILTLLASKKPLAISEAHAV